jgi:hypothetical protein
MFEIKVAIAATFCLEPCISGKEPHHPFEK